MALRNNGVRAADTDFESITSGLGQFDEKCRLREDDRANGSRSSVEYRLQERVHAVRLCSTVRAVAPLPTRFRRTALTQVYATSLPRVTEATGRGGRERRNGPARDCIDCFSLTLRVPLQLAGSLQGRSSLQPCHARCR